MDVPSPKVALAQASAALAVLQRLARRGDLPAESAELLAHIARRIEGIAPAAATAEPAAEVPAPALPVEQPVATGVAELLQVAQAGMVAVPNATVATAAPAEHDGREQVDPLIENRRRDRRSSDGPTQRRLRLLRHLLDGDDALIVPRADPFAPLGHSCSPTIDEILQVGHGESLAVLEDLADLGLLSRELFNVVLACSDCRRVQINFREVCPRCASIELRIEPLLHHFQCAYTGLESEYARGIELVCPKCQRILRQRGQDYDRPHETYVCGGCSSFFEEPLLEAQCLTCEKSFAPAELDQVRIHRFRPTQLAWRALDQGRLTGLDVTHVLYDARVPLLTRSIYLLIFRREFLRLKRLKQPFVTAVLSFVRGAEEYPIFREWDLGSLVQLAQFLTGSLRQLDVVSRLGRARMGVLLVGTDELGAEVVRERLEQQFEELCFTTRDGHPLTTRWTFQVWRDGSESEELLTQQIGAEDA